MPPFPLQIGLIQTSMQSSRASPSIRLAFNNLQIHFTMIFHHCLRSHKISSNPADLLLFISLSTLTTPFSLISTPSLFFHSTHLFSLENSVHILYLLKNVRNHGHILSFLSFSSSPSRSPDEITHSLFTIHFLH